MKQNVILKAAIVAAFGFSASAAFAGQLSANPTINYAKVAIASNATSLPLGNFAYQTSSTLTNGSSVNFVFSLSNGATTGVASTGGSLTSTGTASFASSSASQSTTAAFFGPTIAFGAATSNAVTVTVTIASSAAAATLTSAGSNFSAFFYNASVSLAVGTAGASLNYAPAAPVASGLLVAINGLAGSNLVAGLGVGSSGVVSLAANVTNATATSIETGPAQAILTSADAFKYVFTANTSEKIDVGNKNKFSNVTVTGNLGTFTVTNAATLPVAADGVTAVKSSLYDHIFTLKGNFTAASTAGSVYLATGTSCAGASTASGSLATDYLSAKVTFAYNNALNPAAAGGSVALAFCYVGQTASSATLTPTQFTVDYTGSNNAAATPSTLASIATSGVNLLNLTYNNKQVRVANYIPSSFGPNLQGFLRVVNIGAADSDINVAVYDPSTGALSTAAKLVTLKAGGSTLLSAAQVEAVIGKITDFNFRVLVLSGSTDAILASSLAYSASGIPVDVSATETSPSSSFSGSNQ